MEDVIVLKEDLKKPSLWISSQELKIIKAIAEGKTSKEIGIECAISPKTVETHRHNVLKRLRCHNMPHLINTLWEHKILS